MKFPLPTRYADYDTKGHVNNAVYLTYFEVARERAWLAMEGDPDFPFILAEATVRYLKPAMIGVPLEIEVTTTEIRTKAWVWSYRVTERESGATVAEGRTAQVMYDYAAGATVPIPDELRARLERV